MLVWLPVVPRCTRILLLKHCWNGLETLAELNEVWRNVPKYFRFSRDAQYYCWKILKHSKKPRAFRNPLTKYITYGCIEYTSAQPEVKLTSSMVIGTQKRF
jgi:hypothetical protein